jgi:hypothetical protein
MTDKDDLASLNRLLETAGLVLASQFSVQNESPERIGDLFLKIEEDYRNYKACRLDGEVISRLDPDVHAQFQMALLVLSHGAGNDRQAVPPATDISPAFSREELGVYDILKKFNLLDTYSEEELRQKLIAGDPSVESFFKAYQEIRESLDRVVGQKGIRPGIRHYLKKKGVAYARKFASAFGTDGGQFIVPTSLARHRELDFIGRIKSRLGSNGDLVTFMGTGFTVDKIAIGHDFLKRFQRSGPPDQHSSWIRDNLPKNQYISAVLTEKALAFQKKSFILYAVFAAHSGQYAEFGYDSRPLELKEITGYLESLTVNPPKNGDHVLFCIASPTGFEERGSSSPETSLLESFKFPDLSVCCFDLNANRRFFNKGDRFAVALAKLCDLESEGEKNVKITEVLYVEMDHRLLVDQSVSLAYCTEFAKNHRFKDEERVKKLFYHYATEKNLVVKEIPQTGPVMMKRT